MRAPNTLKYIQLVHFEGNEFYVTTAINIEEAKEYWQQAWNTSPKKTASCYSEDPRD